MPYNPKKKAASIKNEIDSLIEEIIVKLNTKCESEHINTLKDALLELIQKHGDENYQYGHAHGTISAHYSVMKFSDQKRTSCEDMLGEAGTPLFGHED